MAKVIVDLGNGNSVTIRDEPGMNGYVLLRVRVLQIPSDSVAEVALRRDQAEQIISALTTETKRLER